ncbi:hypothetical protein IQ07DRAFT_431379 [Pyrenochaeta sp. DS3sAY3a]|nr:hypothetical protein IQ07DRAFT_431379 [Pyrenochaeta sp. DS3sAY3a]
MHGTGAFLSFPFACLSVCLVVGWLFHRYRLDILSSIYIPHLSLSLFLSLSLAWFSLFFLFRCLSSLCCLPVSCYMVHSICG